MEASFFFNSTNIYQFKAKDNISKDFTINNMKK